MNKIFGSFILLCIFSVVPPAMGDMIVSGWYFVADAEVESSLGDDSKHNEGVDPVSAYAEVLGDQEGAASMAVANWLSVNCWSALEFQPGTTGSVLSSAGEIILGLSSTTPWEVEFESIFSAVSSDYGAIGLTSQAWVLDGEDTELYSYDLANDGPIDTEVFGAGLYELRLYVTSAAVLLYPSLDFETRNSSVELNATVTPVPVPSSALLAFFGLGFSIHRLRRIRII